ncbi:MAG: hypothetical protein K5644_07860 [Lachnospiraceae bacterium]|nr:hypothetical protein [Lachnospiraceae bacterium]
MSNYIFEMIIIVVFLYEAFVLFTKRNGGDGKMYRHYTEESLEKYSIIVGIMCIIAAIYEALIIMQKVEVINIFPVDEEGKLPIWVGLLAIGIVIAVIIILHAVVLKKRDY